MQHMHAANTAFKSCPNADRLEMTLAIPDLRHDTKRPSGKQPEGLARTRFRTHKAVNHMHTVFFMASTKLHFIFYKIANV